MTVALVGPVAVAPAAGCRLFALRGDCMGPALVTGDMLMVAPVARYQGEGVYLLDHGDGEAPYLAEHMIGRGEIAIRHPNPVYERWAVTVAQFNSAVTAKVVAEVKVRDSELLQMGWRQRP